MTRYIKLLLFIILLNCSFDTKSRIWTEDKKIQEVNKNITNVFKEKEIIKKEFNSNLLIKTGILKKDYKQPDNLINHLGILNFNSKIEKSSKFKFSKIENFDHFEPELVFDGENFIFFDDKGNLIKFNNNFEIIWKKNFYSKKERKLKPILTLSTYENYLIIFDNIGKFYSVNLETGNLVWLNNNKNPLNSQIKIFNDIIYIVDLNNILRSFSIKNGKEIWKFNSENTFLKSNKKSSILVKKDKVFFNNSLGDIIAINSLDGKLLWQIPTQSSAIYENAFSLVMSDLVAKDNNLIFSNNRNEFYSINLNNGVMNWKQEINSSVRPIIYNDLIFTISEEGYFFVIDKKSGNILRITDIFDKFKKDKRTNIRPIGFITGLKKVMLSTSNGRLLQIDISTGKTEKILKIDSDKISRPFVFNKEIIIIKNNSIIRMN